MAEQSRPTSAIFDPLALLGRRSARRDAERTLVFDEWNRRFEGRPPPTNRELRGYCKLLLNEPHLIQGQHAPYIYLVLQRWFAKTRPPKRPNSGEDIAVLVDIVANLKKYRLAKRVKRWLTRLA
jgi:hypothetical protein